MTQLKCLNCDALNPPGASECLQCGRATLYDVSRRPAGVLGLASAARNSKTNQASNRIFGAVLLWMCSLFFIWQLQEQWSHASRCSASTAASVDPQYKQVQQRKFNIVWRTSYQVTYRFQANGRDYTGHDSLGDAPTSSAATVFYNPANPDENVIQKPSIWIYLGLVAVASITGVLGALILFRKGSRAGA